MKKVVIIGAGGVAAEVCSYIKAINKMQNEKIEVLGFLDDIEERFNGFATKYKFEAPYLGTFKDYNYKEEEFYIFGFANIQGRIDFMETHKDKNIQFINLIHPSSIIAESANIGEGNLINPYCIIGPNAVVGNNNILTSYSFISHDCIVGNNNFFSTSGLSGHVNVGDNNFFGIRATIIPDITIGSNNTIQAGMIIDKNISDHETVFYKYKEKITIINSINHE
jgi:sugar O-acyltransferase (sialic acid O-acetyltransferase NeuD family)